LLIAFILASCAQVVNVVPTETPLATKAFVPTATFTPEPTVTLTPVIVTLVNFDFRLTGVGEHGAMVCLSPSQAEQTKEIVLSANISQNGKILDRDVKAENMWADGICFEADDAKNKLGLPVSIEVNATSSVLSIANGKQTSDIGNFGVQDTMGNWLAFPFMTMNIYPSSYKEIEGYGFHNPFTKQIHYAIDLQPKTLPNGVEKISDTPLYSPATGIVIRVNRDQPDGKGGTIKVNGIMIYSPYTGYIIMVGHPSNFTPSINYFAPNFALVSENTLDLDRLLNSNVKLGQQIGWIGIKDAVSGMPHTHLDVQIPSSLPPQPPYMTGDGSQSVNYVELGLVFP
jgi:hypothetical protein